MILLLRLRVGDIWRKPVPNADLCRLCHSLAPSNSLKNLTRQCVQVGFERLILRLRVYGNQVRSGVKVATPCGRLEPTQRLKYHSIERRLTTQPYELCTAFHMTRWAESRNNCSIYTSGSRGRDQEVCNSVDLCFATEPCFDQQYFYRNVLISNVAVFSCKTGYWVNTSSKYCPFE